MRHVSAEFVDVVKVSRNVSHQNKQVRLCQSFTSEPTAKRCSVSD